jgi:8-oxo-dGTP pyrophosphatase MutT (NUDIX family)
MIGGSALYEPDGDSPMSTKAIRPLVIAVFRHKDRILVAEAYDPVKGETFYRPLGGEIEFGELSRDAIVREIREEIGAEITDVRFLGTLENRFTFNGTPGHEIVLVYDAAFVDRSLYDQSAIPGREDALDEDFLAVWKRLDEFGPGRPPLYPDGLLDLLQHVAA